MSEAWIQSHHECELTTGSDLTDAIFSMLYLGHVPANEYTGRQFLAQAVGVRCSQITFSP